MCFNRLLQQFKASEVVFVEQFQNKIISNNKILKETIQGVGA